MHELDETSASTVRLQQAVGVVVVVLAVAALLVAGNWGDWFGPARPTYENARSLFEQENWEDAVPIYDVLAESKESRGGRFWFEYAYAVHSLGEYERAVPLHRIASRFSGFESIARYNLACALSMLGKTDEALQELESIEQQDGLSGSYKHMLKDPDLDPLRGLERFEGLMDRLAPPEQRREYEDADRSDRSA